jgi:hypothetical protein
VSRLTRLSTRAYGRLTPAQKEAVDLLQWYSPNAAERGAAKTVLGWRRSREETLAYALELVGQGLGLAAVADRLRVSDDYLHRVLNPEKQGRNRSIHPARSGLTDRGKVIGHP